MAEWTFSEASPDYLHFRFSQELFSQSDLKWVNRQQGSESGHMTADEHDPLTSRLRDGRLHYEASLGPLKKKKKTKLKKETKKKKQPRHPVTMAGNTNSVGH